ncbi:unnamed protein product [Effrenium voratum]|nr:unnamed protein product [Effrenium voratum]
MVAATEAPEAPAPAPATDALESVWRYIGGWYEIKKEDGKLYFHENNLRGELVEQDDWLVAELPPAGSIRLKLGPSGEEVLSNFKPADADWGDSITALKEWESLTGRTQGLRSSLSGTEFAGEAGGVTVKVDGGQRPIALEIADEESSAELAKHIKEAHAAAVGKSLEFMTESLQHLYADHFAAKK